MSLFNKRRAKARPQKTTVTSLTTEWAKILPKIEKEEKVEEGMRLTNESCKIESALRRVASINEREALAKLYVMSANDEIFADPETFADSSTAGILASFKKDLKVLFKGWPAA